MVFGQIKHDLDEALGRPMSLSSVYTLLHRHNWRKLAPDTLILPQVNTQCVQIFLDTVAARHVSDPIVMVMDGAGWHSSKKLIAPSNIRLLALPPYAPELNPVEHLWHELREKCFHNKVFASIDDGITERWKGSFMCHSATAPRVHGLRRCNMVSFVAAVVCTGGVAQGGST